MEKTCDKETFLRRIVFACWQWNSAVSCCSCRRFLYEVFSLCWGGIHTDWTSTQSWTKTSSLQQTVCLKSGNLQNHQMKNKHCCVSGESSAASFYLKTVTFLHFTELHVSALLLHVLLKCWIFLYLLDKHTTQTLCVCSSVFYISRVSPESGFLTSLSFFVDDLQLWGFCTRL